MYKVNNNILIPERRLYLISWCSDTYINHNNCLEHMLTTCYYKIYLQGLL